MSEEQNIKAAVNDLIEKFADYKEQFEKISQTCDAFEAECQRLSARLEVYESLARQSKLLVEKGDLETLKRLYVSVSL